MSSFSHDIAGGSGDLIATSIQSPNFSEADSTGWQITRAGDATFYQITIPGGSGGTVVVFGPSEPASPVTGEVWYDTDNGLAASVWNGTEWVAYSIGTGAIADDAITASQIASATIEGGNIASATIDGGNIASGTITASNIESGTITATQIADGTITGTQIASGTVQASNIEDATITATQIASGTITGTNIASATIEAANIANATITEVQIADGTITTTQISDSADITGTQIASGTVTGSNLVAGTITASQIASGAITTTQIASGTIEAGNIASGTITASQIASETITASQIASGTITATQIESGTITASQIKSGTITATQLASGIVYAGIVDGTTINAGTFTGSVFEGTDFIINDDGAFFYSSTPAEGNLSASVAPLPGTDSYGNAYLAGVVAYEDQYVYGTGYIAGQFLADGIAWQYNTSYGGSYSSAGAVTVDLSTGQLSFTGLALVSTAGTASDPTKVTTDTWHTVSSLPTDWSAIGEGIRYKLNPDNSVRIQVSCQIASGAASGTVTLFTLPSGYVPTYQFRGCAPGIFTGNSSWESGIVNTRFQVTTGGVVEFLGFPGYTDGLTEIDGQWDVPLD